MAEVAGGRGSLLTRLQQSGLIKAGDKLIYKGTDDQEFEGDVIIGQDSAVYVKLGNDELKNEAAFVRKATGDATIPKFFKNTLTIGGRPFRDIHEDYKKANPRPERAERAPRPEGASASSSGSGKAANRRTRRPNVRLNQLVSAGKLSVDTEAWFDSKAGRISGQFVERERRFGFAVGDEFFTSAGNFVRAAETARGVDEADRIAGKWDSAVHVGNTTIREARDQFLAERPPPQPKPATTSSSSGGSSAASSELQQVREQIKKLRERERELLAQNGGSPARGRGRGQGRRRRPRKTDQSE